MAADGSIPPSANRGGKSPRPNEELTDGVSIDYLSVTLPEFKLGEGLDRRAWWLERAFGADDDDGVQHMLARGLVERVFPGAPLTIERERRGFRHFYAHHFRILVGEQVAGFVAFGGESQRHSVNVQLTGEACAHVTAWAHVADQLEQLGATIKRVDCAHDDFSGEHDLAYAESLHASGAFVTCGRPPVMQCMGWEDGSGRTVYIGKDRASGQLCVYEKGREQGARDGDAEAGWVRWEARFGAAERVIPFDVLRAPADYVVARYPALDWIRGVAKRMEYHTRKLQANFASAMRHTRQQCGSFLHAMRVYFPLREQLLDFVERELVRPKLPKWVALSPAAGRTLPDLLGCAA